MINMVTLAAQDGCSLLANKLLPVFVWIEIALLLSYLCVHLFMREDGCKDDVIHMLVKFILLFSLLLGMSMLSRCAEMYGMVVAFCAAPGVLLLPLVFVVVLRLDVHPFHLFDLLD